MAILRVNKTEAEKILLEAFRSRCSKEDSTSSKIQEILGGNHKTYKYILVNGLLAKATDDRVNPIALQAGAPIPGAFDARTLCHGVLVPFEREFLYNSLGGSNEPFLNKPARFTHLSSTNAVRKGQDKLTLLALINILGSLKTSKEAKAYLACALAFLNQRIESLQKLQDPQIKYSPTLIEIYEFILRFVEKSYEGETSVIVVGALEKMYYEKQGSNYKVHVHKVNQSGASSKEVGDIDVFHKKEFNHAIEVKDKAFNSYDIQHAFNKMTDNNARKGAFIYGPNSTFDPELIAHTLMEFEEKRFYTLFQDIYSYSKSMLFKSEIHNKAYFVSIIIATANEINSKEACLRWIHELLVTLGWK